MPSREISRPLPGWPEAGFRTGSGSVPSSNPTHTASEPPESPARWPAMGVRTFRRLSAPRRPSRSPPRPAGPPSSSSCRSISSTGAGRRCTCWPTGRLHYTAHSRSNRSEDLEARGGTHSGSSFPMHLELDTGMGRGGCEEPDARRNPGPQFDAGSPRLRLAGVMTHLPDALDDPDTARDRGRRFPPIPRSRSGDLVPDRTSVRHAAATAALHDADAPIRHGSRIGLGVDRPSAATRRRRIGPACRSSSPALSWWSRLIQVRRHRRLDGPSATDAPSDHRSRHRRGPRPRRLRGRAADQSGLGAASARGPRASDGPVTVARARPHEHGSVRGGSHRRRARRRRTPPSRVVTADPDSAVSLPRVAARAEVMPYELLCGLSARIPADDRRWPAARTPVPEARAPRVEVDGRGSRPEAGSVSAERAVGPRFKPAARESLTGPRNGT